MDLTNFKIIPYFPDYFVNEYGVVYSTLSNKILAQRVRNKSGYLFVTMLTRNKISKNISINRLVANVFLDMSELYNDMEVDHKDRNILNNHYSNLQVLTKEEHHKKTIIENNLIIRNKHHCLICNKMITYGAKYCNFHSPNKTVKNSNLTIDEIEKSVMKYGWKKSSKIHNLSDNGLRKNYKRLGGNPSLLKKIKNNE